MKKKKEQTKVVTFRIAENMYDNLVQMAIKRAKNDGKLIGVSQIIREIIENGIKK